MKIKICGMKYRDNILEVSQLLPDYLGFIFYNKSARFFEGEIPDVPSTIKKVGVFVNETIDNMTKTAKKHRLDVIQLHGNESPELCEKLQKLKIEIIKVFSISDDFDFDEIKKYEQVCNYFLFDTKGQLHGGNGVKFNWDLLQNYHSKKPLFLSGGIGLEEIEQIEQLNLPVYAIDINSKFEIEPGLKNYTLLKNISHLN